MPSRPPITYPLDLVIPPVPPRADVWFGFNCLAASVGIAARRVRRAGRVVYWCVDYVDDRFGSSPVTKAYETLDGFCCRKADARFELSEEARAARSRRHASAADKLAPSRVVPMGAWTDRVPTTPDNGFKARRIVFMGHLIPMQGVGTLIEALALLRHRGLAFTADIIGRGPQLAEHREASIESGLGDVVTFHGFVEKHTDVERMLANASIAVAPYDTTVNTFKRFADPGKIKAYLAAGLPIVMTDVPHNARDLERQGCANVVDFTAPALAAGIERLLDGPDTWQAMRAGSLKVARSFDWNTIIDGALESVGVASGAVRPQAGGF
jgi:glycosyltransferase involved in cell wall biosynthesis